MSICVSGCPEVRWGLRAQQNKETCDELGYYNHVHWRAWHAMVCRGILCYAMLYMCSWLFFVTGSPIAMGDFPVGFFMGVLLGIQESSWGESPRRISKYVISWHCEPPVCFWGSYTMVCHVPLHSRNKLGWRKVRFRTLAPISYGGGANNI